MDGGSVCLIMVSQSSYFLQNNHRQSYLLSTYELPIYMKYTGRYMARTQHYSRIKQLLYCEKTKIQLACVYCKTKETVCDAQLVTF